MIIQMCIKCLGQLCGKKWKIGEKNGKLGEKMENWGKNGKLGKKMEKL